MGLTFDVASLVDRLSPIQHLRAGISRAEEGRWAGRTAEFGGEAARTLRVWFSLTSWLRPVREYRRRVLDPRLTHAQRSRALFRGVMAGLADHYYPWNDINTNPPLREIFEAAGVKVRWGPVRTGHAVCSWAPADPPVITIKEDLPEGLTNLALWHELFHLASHGGMGQHCDDPDHPTEILAYRFAFDAGLPLPAIAAYASQRTLSDFAGLRGPCGDLVNLIRVTRKPVIVLEYSTGDSPANGSGPGIAPVEGAVTRNIAMEGHAGLRARGRTLRGLRVLAESSNPHRDPGLFWGAPEGNRVLGIGEDGLVCSVGDSAEMWAGLVETGFFAGMETGPGDIAQFFRHFPGGQPCVVYSVPGRRIALAGYEEYSTRVLICVRDDDGSLAKQWLQARAHGTAGSVLPPGDGVLRRQPLHYEDWVRRMERTFVRRPLWHFLRRWLVVSRRPREGPEE